MAGDIVRRIVARTMSQQSMSEVQHATAPFQNALATKSGCESIAHALQGFDMLDGVKYIARGSALPFVGVPQVICGKMISSRGQP